MEIKKADFVKSATKIKDFPEPKTTEFAFVGKSNVGKSSLINSLSNRRGLAKTSKTPGRTQLVNFFIMNNEFYFVDLPGYGFAKVPVEVKQSWGEMIERYLQSERKKIVLLLLDIRREPGEDEENLLEWLKHYEIEYYIVFTKVDKLSNNERAKQLGVIRKKIPIEKEKYFMYSSLTREGREKLVDFIVSRGITEKEDIESGRDE